MISSTRDRSVDFFRYDAYLHSEDVDLVKMKSFSKHDGMDSPLYRTEDCAGDTLTHTYSNLLSS